MEEQIIDERLLRMRKDIDASQKEITTLKAIIELYQQLDPTIELQKLCQRIKDFLIKYVGAENIRVNINSTTVRKYTNNLTACTEKAIDTYLAKNSTPFIVPIVNQDFMFNTIKELQTNTDTIIAYPIIINEINAGSISLHGTKKLIEQREFIAVITANVNIILERHTEFTNAQHNAITDALTGLYNKAYFWEALQREIEHAIENKKPTTLIMFDLDNFKQYNDTRGHPAGDELLKTASAIVKKILPHFATATRYGGEEFAIILPETKQDSAYAFAENLRSKMQEELNGVTISIGFVACLNSTASPKTMVDQADNALYKAKRTGKNKIVPYLIIDKLLGVIDVEEAMGESKK